LVESEEAPEGCTLHRLQLEHSGSARLTVVARRTLCSLADLVPLAGQIADALVAQAAAQEGKAFSCRQGCSACCRFLTPVSAAEAQWLWRQLAGLPEPRRTALLRRFILASRKILNAQPPTSEPATLAELSRWYRSLDIACPLLEADACCLYENRPLACREFNVRSSPGECLREDGHVVRPEPAVSVAEGLDEISGELMGAGPILLPLSMAWASEQDAGRGLQMEAGLWVERLFQTLRRRAAKRKAG